MVDLFSSKCTSFRFVVFEKDSFLDCLERMKSSRIVVESRITLRCIYLSLSLSLSIYIYMFFLLVYATPAFVHFCKKSRIRTVYMLLRRYRRYLFANPSQSFENTPWKLGYVDEY